MAIPNDDFEESSLETSALHSQKTSISLDDGDLDPFRSASPSCSSSRHSNASFSFNGGHLSFTPAEGLSGRAHLENLKCLTYWSGVGLIVGAQIGAAIFSSPSLVNRNAGSVGMSLIVWLIAGCLSWAGACMSLARNCQFDVV